MINIDNLGKPLRWSRFASFLENRDLDVVAIYHSINMDVVYLDINLFHSISHYFTVGSTIFFTVERINRNFKKEKIREILLILLRNKLLVDVVYDEYKELKKIAKTYTGCDTPSIMYLLLTDQCNFNCKYCFVENPMPEDMKFSNMSIEVARASIDQFFKATSKLPTDHERSIIFYGGEPTINREVLIGSLEYINKCETKYNLKKHVELTLNTNGYLIDNNLASFLRKYNVDVSLSIDGFEKIHNKYRTLKDGSGTFSKVINTLRMLQFNGVNVGISCTITDTNINHLNDIISWFKKDLNVNSLGFNFLLGSHDLLKDEISYMENVSDKIIEAFKFGRESEIYEDRILRKVEAFVNKSIYPFDCGACGHQIVVAPEGAIGPCHAYLSSRKYFTLNVYEETLKTNENEVFVDWGNRSPLNMPQCFDCISLGICGGGCPHNAEYHNGTIWSLDERFCVHSKKTLEWLIWDLYDNQ